MDMDRTKPKHGLRLSASIIYIYRPYRIFFFILKREVSTLQTRRNLWRARTV